MNLIGMYECDKNNRRHPPILHIDIQSDEIFSFLKNIICKEMFLRVRKLHSKFRKIGISTIGDDKTNEINYDEHELNLIVDVKEIDDHTIAEINNSPVYVINLMGSIDMLCFYIDKTNEAILDRKLFSNK